MQSRRFPVLATGCVRLHNNTGVFTLARVLFDTGSEVNLITERAVRSANLPKKKFSIQLEGITGSRAAEWITHIKITPWFDEHGENALYKTCVVLKQLPIAQRTESMANVTEFNQIVKADPKFNKAGFADILLGIDTWAEIVMTRVLRSTVGLCAQQTTFGYAIFGAVEATRNLAASVSFVGRVILGGVESQRLDEILQRFWEQEEDCSSDGVMSAEEQRAVDYYKQTTVRGDNGEFIVRLPFIEGDTELGDSRKMALHRFYQLERRLDQDEELKQKYHEAMRESIEANYMRLATERERNATGYYIPHHPVKTRFRVVLDGSCTTTNGKSVNDIQLAGPNLQDKLAYIIMRFRFHRFVLSADIKKMFLRIRMNDEDLKYQKIFWRFSKSDPLQEYVLQTVILGMKSSPFIAINTVLELTKIYGKEFPLAARAARRERYVDDFMTGADSQEQVIQLYHELRQMMACARFELGKYKTNCPRVMEHINGDSRANDQPLELTDDSTSVLGLNWQPGSDCFVFSIDERWDFSKQVTKRTIAGAIARIYDPNGYLAPVMIKAKAFLQSLWKLKVDWEEQLSNEIQTKWHEFYATLPAINELKIPRWIQTTQGREVELIGFADASELGYGAVIYVRCSSGTSVWCNMLTAKTKVAPVKTVTIPRLELCAARLLASLMNTVRTKCELKYVPYECYTDSLITLSWIQKCPSKLKIYVATRVRAIQEFTPTENWFYVPSKKNPADIASRGTTAGELITCSLWWHGPDFIFKDRTNRERFQLKVSEKEQETIQSEYRPVGVAKVNTFTPQCITYRGIPLIEWFSDYTKIIRITAYVLKAKNALADRVRAKDDNVRAAATTGDQSHVMGTLTRDELARGALYWIRYTQTQYYAREIGQLERNEEVDKNSNLSQVCPFIDSCSALRVRGRLENANVTYDEKHPYILPQHSRWTTLLMEHAHRETLHGGVQLMLHYVRTTHWVIGGRRAAAFVVKNCLACVRFAKHDRNQIMGDLPRERLTNTRPFVHCGVDYFGPIRVRRYEGRCNSVDTGYGAVFVCMTTRMIHIECVSDLTTERFLWAFERLATIYQMPESMFSDNGRTFLGAKNELLEVLKSWRTTEMENFLTRHGIKWKFITPRAPNQGGIWEAAVKSAKHHLKRLLLDKSLTFERYQTLFAKVTAVLNSRPLVPLSDDPTDLNYLTPSHAHIGERVVQPLSENLRDIPLNRLKQQKVLNRIHQDFWQAWRKDYISTLQNRYKWNRKEPNLLFGDFVLLKEENVPPAVWPMARVMETYPGADGRVRSVKIRTAKTDLVRPVNKLVHLPIENTIEEVPESTTDQSTSG